MPGPELAHVAPDSTERRYTNTLVPRPTYRIALRLGEIDDLFSEPPDTELGRMARLQVLGLFYFPLRHAMAAERAKTCWEWVRSKIVPQQEGETGDFLRNALRARVVGEANAPFESLGSFRSGLPEAAENPDCPGEKNFARIRLPGGFTYLNSSSIKVNEDLNYPLEFGADLFDAESRFYADNPVLGKLPLVAKVLRRSGQGEGWVPAEGVHVYFRLVKPYPLSPAYDRTTATQGIDASIAKEEATHIVQEDADPQTGNCHADRGGKRGAPLASSGDHPRVGLFKIVPTPGFNEPHPSRPLVRKTWFPCAESVADPRKHPDAVTAETNGEGEAGVIFMPSQMGGDRFRIRAFIGPPTTESDGADAAAVRAETGTLVVWRNVRISRFLRKEPAQSVLPDLIKEAEEFGYGADEDYLLRLALMNASYEWQGLPEISRDEIVRRFACAFCELEFDGGKLVPEVVEKEEYASAYRQAIDDATEGAVALGTEWEPDQLLLPPSEAVQGESIVHLPMHSPAAYNARVGAETTAALRLDPDTGELPQDEKEALDVLIDNYMFAGLLRGLSKNGSLPGLTLLQGAGCCTWDVLQLRGTVALGQSKAFRGCGLWFGKQTYANPGPAGYFWDLTGCAVHEIGHCLFREHAPGSDPPRKGAAGARTEEHDPLSKKGGGNVCVMAYKHSPGFFCSRCTLALRGWDVKKASPTSEVPPELPPEVS
ncbi:MAG: hypothetical protein HYY17_12095 [Planctomycetes bacterium]|nr:hypothetical protein [Planctomycetota bacterium]